jgi:RNA polymerase sigma factor (sigma-70 family)
VGQITNFDERACHDIYLQYSKTMYHTCLRILNNRADAEDALQEAFVKAFKNLHTFKAEAALGTWLKRIAINECLNFLQRRKIKLFVDDGQLARIPEETANQDDIEEDLLHVNRIKNAIPLLPDSYRIVLSLYLLDGYDHVEIAEIMGITESTSKSQFHRAKAKLRSILEASSTLE